MPKPMTRREARERNRQALLAAAAEVVLEHGFEDAMLTEIAARAGLTKGAIYSIFGSKRDLLVALIRDLFASGPLLEVDEAVDSRAPLERRLHDHAAAVERLCRGERAQRELRLELELAGLAVRDEGVLTVVSEEREARVIRLAERLGHRRVARALLALEQGWAAAVAFGATAPRGELARAAAALAQLDEGRG